MKRSTLIVVSLFIVLLVAALMLSKKPAQRGGQELDLSSLTPETLSGVIVKAPEGEKTVTLRKEGGIWKLADGHLADPEAVKRALDAIGEIRTTDLVSTSAARREKYGVGDEKALRIELQGKDTKPVVLLLGSSAKGGGYIRRDGTNAIFKLKRNISYLFPSESKRWLKLKLVDAAIEDLKGVKIALKDEIPYELIPGDDEAQWKLRDDSILPEGFRFDGKAARALVQQALSCRAGEIVDELPEGTDAGLDQDRITLELEDGAVTLHLGASAGKNLVWARVDGREPFFKVPEYQARNLRKKVEDLRDLHLMNFEKEKISDLRIDAGKTAIHLHKGDDGSWSIDEKLSRPPKDFQFDPAMVDGFISSLANLRAEKFIGPKPGGKTGLDHPTGQFLRRGKMQIGEDDLVLQKFVLGRQGLLYLDDHLGFGPDILRGGQDFRPGFKVFLVRYLAAQPGAAFHENRVIVRHHRGDADGCHGNPFFIRFDFLGHSDNHDPSNRRNASFLSVTIRCSKSNSINTSLYVRKKALIPGRSERARR